MWPPVWNPLSVTLRGYGISPLRSATNTPLVIQLDWRRLALLQAALSKSLSINTQSRPQPFPASR